MEIRVLGSIEVWNGELIGVGGPRQRRILAALAMDAGSVVSLDRLVDVTWSGGGRSEHDSGGVGAVRPPG